MQTSTTPIASNIVLGTQAHAIAVKPIGLNAPDDAAVVCVAAGIVSSLQSSNVRLRRALRNQESLVQHPRYPLLFDPEHAGGPLASVPMEQALACVQLLHAPGYGHAAVIGRVQAQTDTRKPITLRG